METTKNVVITGAGSGLGASLAKKYNKMGYFVTMLDYDRDKLNAVAKTFKNNKYKIMTLNITKPQRVIETFISIHREVGPTDILVNSAGVGYFDVTEQLRIDHINQMIDTNLKGTIFCTQQVIPEMKERNQGTIINILPTSGLEGKVNESVYSASKFGVRGFTESLEKELQDTHIQVAAFYIDSMDTPFWDGTPEASRVDEMMDPDDIADIIIQNTKDQDKSNVSEMVIKDR